MLLKIMKVITLHLKCLLYSYLYFQTRLLLIVKLCIWLFNNENHYWNRCRLLLISLFFLEIKLTYRLLDLGLARGRKGKRQERFLGRGNFPGNGRAEQVSRSVWKAKQTRAREGWNGQNLASWLSFPGADSLQRGGRGFARGICKLWGQFRSDRLERFFSANFLAGRCV